ncbi:MAG: GGDEF domain-containing protein [Deltaproteobacteria bacterium]|nr:GGDEF domain-containing protein [Deltaproteobacteria bacterium]
MQDAVEEPGHALDAFSVEMARINLERLPRGLTFMAVLHCVHVVVFALLVARDDASTTRWADLIATTHAAMILPAALLAWRARSMVHAPARWRAVPLVTAGVYLALTAALAAIDQIVDASPIAFVVGGVGLAVFFRLDRLATYLIYAVALAVALVAIELIQDDGAMRRFAQINCVSIAIVSVVIARSSERMHRQMFADRRTIERQATTDALTGALTRGALTDALGRALGRPAALILLDVDHLKAINDRSGHTAGDAVLIAVTTATRSATRVGDVIGRLGGDELVVLLPGADLTVALAVAERIRSAVAAAGAGASLGVAAHEPGEAIERWLARADEALYRAKNAGRDRVAS